MSKRNSNRNGRKRRLLRVMEQLPASYFQQQTQRLLERLNDAEANRTAEEQRAREIRERAERFNRPGNRGEIEIRLLEEEKDKAGNTVPGN